MNSAVKAVALLGAAAALYGCQTAASDGSGSTALPAGVPRSEKVEAQTPVDPASVAAGGSGMPIPGSTAPSGKALVDAPVDPTGISSGGSGMPIPSNK